MSKIQDMVNELKEQLSMPLELREVMKTKNFIKEHLTIKGSRKFDKWDYTSERMLGLEYAHRYVMPFDLDEANLAKVIHCLIDNRESESVHLIYRELLKLNPCLDESRTYLRKMRGGIHFILFGALSRFPSEDILYFLKSVYEAAEHPKLMLPGCYGYISSPETFNRFMESRWGPMGKIAA